MPSPRHASRSLRLTLVTAGLAIGALGGVAAGGTVAFDAASTLTPASAEATPVLRVAADRALTETLPAAAPTAGANTTRAPARRPAQAKRPVRRESAASRSEHRRAVRPRPPRHALRFGSRGSKVRWLQARLGVRHTGHFARHTRSAVRRFQYHHHLHPDGVVGRRTWTLLVRTRRHAPTHRHHVRHHAHRHHAHRHHVRPHRVARHHHLARHHRLVLRRTAQLTVRQQILRVLRVARAQRGKPYVWGAAGPHAFDCSGYVQWVFRHALGRRLPKYTDTQYGALEHIRARKLRAGDLIFVREGRHESHVGIYAGHHRWWVAPHTGSHVKLQKVWGFHNVYARVIH